MAEALGKWGCLPAGWAGTRAWVLPPHSGSKSWPRLRLPGRRVRPVSKWGLQKSGILTHACCPGDTLRPVPQAPRLGAQGSLCPCLPARKQWRTHCGSSGPRGLGAQGCPGPEAGAWRDGVPGRSCWSWALALKSAGAPAPGTAHAISLLPAYCGSPRVARRTGRLPMFSLQRDGVGC